MKKVSSKKYCCRNYFAKTSCSYRTVKASQQLTKVFVLSANKLSLTAGFCRCFAIIIFSKNSSNFFVIV